MLGRVQAWLHLFNGKFLILHMMVVMSQNLPRHVYASQCFTAKHYVCFASDQTERQGWRSWLKGPKVPCC
ncbi:hypothetical protein PVAP13_4NG093300 [Panicum virgatum]|uniref:Secreted protein n=1 Tax=Panicum virgatum TaxID=38727 RepID=A0A8T0TC95_PANVG|nr:hypothetical protein PVAP13_4NG093300 [Panicum virgatum]